MEFSGRGFKSHSDQLFIATSKNFPVRIPYVLIHSSTNMITCARFRLKQILRLTKTMAERKREHSTLG